MAQTRRLLFLLVVFCPLHMLCAAAENNGLPAALRKQATQGWHQVYTAYGRTIIVEIPIQIPDTDQFAVIETSCIPPLTNPVKSSWKQPALFQGTGLIRLNSHSPQAMQQANAADRYRCTSPVP